MALIEAIEDVKQAILDGEEVDFDAIANEHGLRAVFLKNRAAAVIGDFDKFAEKHANVASATKAMAEEQRRQALRNRLDQKIRDHNASTGTRNRLSDEELADAIRAANALGSRWMLVSKPVRRQPEVNIDALFDKLMKSLLQ